MSTLSFIVWTIARSALTIYALLEFSDYVLMLFQRQRYGVVIRQEWSLQSTIALGVVHGVIFFIGAIVGGMRGNFLGLTLLLVLMIAGSVLGTVCQWVTPLRSVIGGRDR